MTVGVVRVQFDVDKFDERQKVLEYVQADYITSVCVKHIICHMQKEDLELLRKTLKCRVWELNSVK